MGYLAIVLMIHAVHTGSKFGAILSFIVAFFALIKDVFGE